MRWNGLELLLNSSCILTSFRMVKLQEKNSWICWNTVLFLIMLKFLSSWHNFSFRSIFVTLTITDLNLWNFVYSNIRILVMQNHNKIFNWNPLNSFKGDRQTGGCMSFISKDKNCCQLHDDWVPCRELQTSCRLKRGLQ